MSTFHFFFFGFKVVFGKRTQAYYRHTDDNRCSYRVRHCPVGIKLPTYL